jgi:hypothetical protein
MKSASSISFLAREMAPRIALGLYSPVIGRSPRAGSASSAPAGRPCRRRRSAGRADGGAVAPQDPGAQGVERAHGDLAAGLLADQAGDAGAQLGRGLVGEGDGQDLPRPDALDADEVRDAVGQDARLAALPAPARIRTGPSVVDGALLLGVEAGQDPLGEGLGGGLPLGQRDRLGLERRRLARLDAGPVEGLRRRLSPKCGARCGRRGSCSG